MSFLSKYPKTERAIKKTGMTLDQLFALSDDPKLFNLLLKTLQEKGG